MQAVVQLDDAGVQVHQCAGWRLEHSVDREDREDDGGDLAIAVPHVDL